MSDRAGRFSNETMLECLTRRNKREKGPRAKTKKVRERIAKAQTETTGTEDPSREKGKMRGVYE